MRGSLHRIGWAADFRHALEARCGNSGRQQDYETQHHRDDPQYRPGDPPATNSPADLARARAARTAPWNRAGILRTHPHPGTTASFTIHRPRITTTSPISRTGRWVRVSTATT